MAGLFLVTDVRGFFSSAGNLRTISLYVILGFLRSSSTNAAHSLGWIYLFMAPNDDIDDDYGIALCQLLKMKARGDVDHAMWKGIWNSCTELSEYNISTELSDTIQLKTTIALWFSAQIPHVH